jgi:hypothetical protein
MTTRLIGYLKQFVAETIGSLPLRQEGMCDVRMADQEDKANAEKPPESRLPRA